MSAPVLAYPDPNREYLLEMDASRLGLGFVLSQKQSDGKYHPVAFGSRALHGVEANYHSSKLEFLAMKWSIEHFQMYLLGHRFKVCTDNNPLTYFLTLHTEGLPLMVVIVMQDTKARREWTALSLIDSGGWVSMKMSTEQSRIADDVNSMEGRRKRLPWSQ